MMRFAVLMLLLLPIVGYSESTFRERVAISKQLILFDSPRDALENMHHSVKEHPMFSVVMENLDFNKINQDAAELMAANFTIEELEALMNFYQGEHGRSAAKKMGTYKKAIGITVHDEMMAIVKEEMKKQQGAASGGFGGGRR